MSYCCVQNENSYVILIIAVLLIVTSCDLADSFWYFARNWCPILAWHKVNI